MRRAPERLISVVVPVYEEAENIGPCLRGLGVALADLPHEILVVYDFPEDGTLRAIAAMPDAPATLRLVRNDLGRGVAFALRKGLEEARGDVVVTFMADLSDPPEVIRAMARKIREDGAQVVSGSRYMAGGRQIGGPFLKRSLSRLAGVSLYWLAGVGTRDATTNFRAYAGDYLRRVRLQSRSGFTAALELTVKAHRLGLPVDEVPSTWTDRTAGTSRFRVLSWLPHYLRWYAVAFLPSVRGGVTFAIALALLLGLDLSWMPKRFGPTLDDSWMIVLSEAFARGRQFGRDIIFTYGPWGFVTVGVYHPATFTLMLVAQGFFCLALAAGLTRLAALGFRHWWSAIAWVVALCVLSCPLFGLSGDVAFLHCAAVLILLHEMDDQPRLRPRLRPALALLIVAVAWAGLVKFGHFVLGVVLVAAIAGADVLRRRPRAAAIVLVFAGALGGLWLAAGQGPGGIVPFIRYSLEITRGYSDAMAAWKEPVVHLVPFLAAVGCFVGARLCSTRGAGDALRTLAFGWLLFQVFKGSFVRHDGHEALGFMVLPVLALLLAPFAWRRARGWLGRAFLVALFVASLWPQIAGWRVFMGQTWLEFVTRNVQSARVRVAAAAGLLQGHATAKTLALQHMAAASRAREELGFPAAQGTVDLYPSEQGYIVAYRWPWGGRPVFQSYVAYTPALAELNANHLRGAGAPDTIFFAVEPVDRRFPALEDALSWPELVARYRVRGGTGRYLWLERAERPRAYELVPIGEMAARLGEQVTVPASDLVWARVDLRPTLLGRIVRLLYKVPQPTLTVNGQAGFRLVPDLLRTGFLLSPVVLNREAFAALAMSRGGIRATSLRIDVDDGGSYFEPEIRIEFLRVAFTP
jgi:glycosyltransferase involved in cell wall biosynthesis